jgi:hypothetical protein
MGFGLDKWQGTSPVNALIMYAADVTKWRWGDKSAEGWGKFPSCISLCEIPAANISNTVSLTEQQRQLTQHCLSQVAPLLERKADKTKGEIFPTVWYSSDAEMTGVQHFELARMILIAEDPNLE